MKPSSNLPEIDFVDEREQIDANETGMIPLSQVIANHPSNIARVKSQKTPVLKHFIASKIYRLALIIGLTIGLIITYAILYIL